MSIKSRIRTIENYPIEGVMFRDITTLLKDPIGLRSSIDAFVNRYKDLQIDKVVAIESRGFIIGAPLAYLLNIGLVLIRKPGKLPSDTIKQNYELEYGTDCIEVHTDAINEGDKVLIVDDLIATGGTAIATADLCQELGATTIHTLSLIDLPELGGSKKIANKYGEVRTLIDY